MSPEEARKKKGQSQQKPGLKHVLDGLLDRLGEGLDELVNGLQPRRPQPVPIPVPARRPRKR